MFDARGRENNNQNLTCLLLLKSRQHYLATVLSSQPTPVG